jgi:hypothetical protein
MASPEVQRLLRQLADLAGEAGRVLDYIEGLGERSTRGTKSDANKKAKAWLEELHTKIAIMGSTDYRTHEYRLAVDDVLRLCKNDYVTNALNALNER